MSLRKQVAPPFWMRASLLAIFWGSLLIARDGASQDATPTPAAATATDPDLAAAIQKLLSDPHLEGTQIAVAVLDVGTNKILAAANEHAAMNPASNAKLYTAAAALALVHGDHRYETVLLGSAHDQEVTGNLVLRGHGDPSLETADLFAMAEDLHGQGIRRVTGDIIVDQRNFDEQTTPPAFDQKPSEWAAFRAPVSAVALNENTLTLTVRPGAPGEAAHASFDPPGFVDAEGSVMTGDDGADTVGLELAGSGQRMTAKLSGKIGSDSRYARYTRRVEDPTLLAGFALKAMLDEVGIKVAGDVKSGPGKATSLLVKHQSRPLSDLLYALGKQSDNFYAEMIFKSIAGELKGRPAKSADSATLVTQWVNKVGAGDNGLTIKNGSGLYDANRVTTFSVVELLRAAWLDPSIQPEYVSQLSIGGVDGTLHKRFHDLRSRRVLRAKTGTLDDVAALSGYVSTGPGKSPVAFSILVNHAQGKVGEARPAMDRVVDKIVERYAPP
ncbi:MAG: D-alanyl-D-alanine carboxypeptidase/D-alanyl-D-alanine endopeptidase [Polyangiaceae bacterium]